MNRMKVRCLSGAADEIGFLFGYVEGHIAQKIKFIAEHGISSGAIVQFVKMCGDWSKATELILTFNPKNHIFGFLPLSLRGICIAIYSVLTKKTGLWPYKKLEKVLREVCSEEDFNSYSGVPVFVGIVNEHGIYQDKALHRMTFEEALTAVIQSSTVQLVARTKHGKADGGIANHIGSEYMADRYKKADIYSCFARVKTFSKKRPKGTLKYFGWILSRIFHTVSKKNEIITDLKCQINGTTHYKSFMEYDVIEGMFDIKPHQNKELYEMGIKVSKIG